VRFSLIDRITELRDGECVTAIKVLTLSEEYLADHFPLFPVMPGVMMLESMYQACAWLIRKTDNFSHALVVLRETRNVKFSSFVEPGQVLTVRGQLQSRDDRLATFKAEASVEGRGAVSARLILERYNAVDRLPARAASDARARRHYREYFDILYRPETVASKS
jgi:3-hydroxyacyl-[acyl-carrier-protein] dehydratase